VERRSGQQPGDVGVVSAPLFRLANAGVGPGNLFRSRQLAFFPKWVI
jgi:hypothetical protein